MRDISCVGDAMMKRFEEAREGLTRKVWIIWDANSLS